MVRGLLVRCPGWIRRGPGFSFSGPVPMTDGWIARFAAQAKGAPINRIVKPVTGPAAAMADNGHLMSAQETQAAVPEGRSPANEYLQALTAGIGGDEIDLPGFPQVVQQLQLVLADEDASIRDIVRLINTEPVLTAKLLRTANSAHFNPAGKQIHNLQFVVSRLGFNLVRSIAIAYATQQVRELEAMVPIRRELDEIWHASNHVAAICAIIGRRTLGRRADEAMVAGLVHQIGSLYLLAQVQAANPALRGDGEFAAAIEGWNPAATTAILKTWRFPATICAAVAAQDRLPGGEADAMDPFERLLAAAKLRNALVSDPLFASAHPEAAAGLDAVCFDQRTFGDLLASCHADIQNMQNALT